ncbi:dynamin family protein [Malikia sp.]|uniref:dynamin family protein n=1 Tax=Malikia sp. TaxID=2070706 RepID=UPI00262D39FA|nr:dynamin family protein [Malikia sp.]MDD2728417.1 dynamin family protein [Malikia sp.]
MTQAHNFFAEIQSALPPAWQEPVAALAAETMQADRPLRLILVGGFSVGKSSLLNMLLQEPLLQTALEETTALPTFIEYGAEREMLLVGQDGSSRPLDEAGFAAATTQAPEGAACAMLALPLSWLEGVSIIDLPGLGSVSQTHREYTLAQIRQADVVLYLLTPSGPSKSDTETLALIQQAGKRVKLMVARWDEVETSVARGEKMPSLEQWAAQIEQASGLRARLAPCHRDGLGRDEIIDFVQRARTDLDGIRLRRFQAELKPILQNALGFNAEQQRSCQVDSEAQAQALHQELLQRKHKLAEFKSAQQAEQQQDRQRIEQQASASVQAERQQFKARLDAQAEQLTGESGWNTFGQQGSELLRTATSRLAQTLSGLSSNYGALQLPEAEVAEFNLRLPEPETVTADDFLDFGKLSQLEQQIVEQQEQFAVTEQKLAAMNVADMSESEQALRELLQQKNAIAAQPLPTVTQRVKEGNGASIGRMVGEIGDIGLMFVNPAAVGAKAAAIVGKGAKMVNVVVDTAKVGAMFGTGLEVVQGRPIDKASTIPHQLTNKLGMLEMLSLGYWGERIGGMFGGPVDVEVVDPEAVAARDAALAELEKQSQALRRTLARNEDIANEKQLTGWALEQSRKEQQRLQAELVRLKAQAEQKQRDAQKQLQQQRQNQIRHGAERAVSQWLRGFDRQSAAMTELLHARVKSHWEDRVAALIDERLQDIGRLDAQAQASSADKRALLAQLRDEATAIERTLAALH